MFLNRNVYILFLLREVGEIAMSVIQMAPPEWVDENLGRLMREAINPAQRSVYQ